MQWALDIAMRYLGPAARSCWEVSRHLTGKGFSEDEAQAACARLVELGILGDFAFARSWAEQATSRRGEAQASVAVALANRGVAAEVIADALAEVFGEEGEGDFERALAVGQQRLRVLHGSALSVRRRLGSFLARRGYDMDVVNGVCARLVGSSWEDRTGEE